mmetsp:Transcript_11992/g.27195  ORF Transcript_11992/g.27195 Transcript_11992/m.27195 type:complete len:232 (+) Transcript_11992:124-819(+)
MGLALVEPRREELRGEEAGQRLQVGRGEGHLRPSELRSPHRAVPRHHGPQRDAHGAYGGAGALLQGKDHDEPMSLGDVRVEADDADENVAAQGNQEAPLLGRVEAAGRAQVLLARQLLPLLEVVVRGEVLREVAEGSHPLAIARPLQRIAPHGAPPVVCLRGLRHHRGLRLVGALAIGSDRLHLLDDVVNYLLASHRGHDLPLAGRHRRAAQARAPLRGAACPNKKPPHPP